MDSGTILIELFFGIACLAALVAVGAIIYSLSLRVYNLLFRKKKLSPPNEGSKPPTLPPTQ
jgi:hypothetical protein